MSYQFKAAWAQSSNGVIGVNGGLPWHLPEDLKHFYRTTKNHSVLMGRKTWDSLPEKVKPLSSRKNYVLSREVSLVLPSEVNVFRSVEEVLLHSFDSDVWVIGGSEIYKLLLPYITEVSVTRVLNSFEGDTYAPSLERFFLESEPEVLVSSTGLHYQFETWVR